MYILSFTLKRSLEHVLPHRGGFICQHVIKRSEIDSAIVGHRYKVDIACRTPSVSGAVETFPRIRFIVFPSALFFIGGIIRCDARHRSGAGLPRAGTVGIGARGLLAAIALVG
jgi:hypothetical protein